MRPQTEIRHITGDDGGKSNPCYKLTKDKAELCSSYSSTIELVHYENGCLAKAISKQSAEGVALVPPHTSQKREGTQRGLLTFRKEAYLRDLENCLPIHTKRMPV